jgi:hypothetical protein
MAEYGTVASARGANGTKETVKMRMGRKENMGRESQER